VKKGQKNLGIRGKKKKNNFSFFLGYEKAGLGGLGHLTNERARLILGKSLRPVRGRRGGPGVGDGVGGEGGFAGLQKPGKHGGIGEGESPTLLVLLFQNFWRKTKRAGRRLKPLGGGDLFRKTETRGITEKMRGPGGPGARPRRGWALWGAEKK